MSHCFGIFHYLFNDVDRMAVALVLHRCNDDDDDDDDDDFLFFPFLLLLFVFDF